MKETHFKNTELGPIPMDWEVTTLGEIGSIAMCKRVFKEQTHTHGDIPFYKIGTFGGTADAFISRSLFNFLRTEYRYPTKGVLLISAAGTIGRIVEYNGEEAYFQDSNIIWLEHKEGIALNRYLKHLFKVIKWQTENGGIVTRLYNSNFNATSIALPSLDEQEKIAEALSDVDALIAELGELIEKKRLVKQGAMQQLLTAKRRLPGFSKPWVEKRLGDVCDINRGGSPRPIEDYITSNPNGINWIKIGDTSSESKYITKTAEKIKPEGARFSRMVKAGDFILSNSMSFGRPYILAIDGCIHDGWLVIQNYESEYNVDFLYYILSSDVVFDQYISAAAGSSVKNLNKEKVADVIIYAPSDIAEQRAIAEILTDMDNEIAELEAKREKYRAIKEGMMQQLLTGRIRLIDSTASSGTIDPSASINSDGDTPAAHTPPITYEPSTSYPQSLAAEPTILE